MLKLHHLFFWKSLSLFCFYPIETWLVQASFLNVCMQFVILLFQENNCQSSMRPSIMTRDVLAFSLLGLGEARAHSWPRRREARGLGWWGWWRMGATNDWQPWLQGTIPTLFVCMHSSVYIDPPSKWPPFCLYVQNFAFSLYSKLPDGRQNCAYWEVFIPHIVLLRLSLAFKFPTLGQCVCVFHFLY